MSKLNDPTLPIELQPVSLEKPELISDAVEKINYTFGVDARLEANLFNAEGDQDPSGVFGKKPDALIPFEPSFAWLKYIGQCNIKLKSGLDIQSIGFEMDVAAGLTSYTYRIHKASDDLKESILADVASLKTIFSKDHIKGLAVNEGVGLEFGGKLTASVTLSWADVWTTGFTSLSRLLDASELIRIKFGAAASIKTKVMVADSFRTQLIKKGADKYSLRLKRNQSSTFSTSASLSVGIAIENPDVITSHLNAILEDLLQVGFSKLETIAGKTINSLTKGDKEILDKIADRLGWEGDDILGKLKNEVGDLKKKYMDKIEEAVSTKVKAGFTYEYLRSTEKEDVFSATLTEKGVDRFHSDILKANVKSLIDFTLSNEKPGLLSDVSFLSVLVTKRERSWGFSIGFGKWVASDQNKVAIKVTSRRTEKGLQLSYDGRRSFESKVGDEKRSWRVDFNAGMPAVSNHNVPVANEFDYSLYLNYEFEDPRFRKDSLIEFLDLCRLWNIINEGQFFKLREDLSEELKKSTRLTYTAHNTYPVSLFEMMMVAMGNASHVLDDLYYLSLGAALPYWSDYSIRTDPDKRAQLYAPIWKEYEETSSVIPHEIAFAHLKKVDKKLAEEEFDFRPNGLVNFKSFAFIARSNPQTLTRWKTFRQGMSSLARAIDPGALEAHTPLIKTAFEKMEDNWTLPHHVRAFGNFLTRIASQFSLQAQDAVRTGEIRYTKDSKEQVIIIGKS
ncbi:MAG TPA: hypothetical protein VFW11_02880 [Cyclobacteriaceae bacterium]|nr:hypothetical protein [Cyclobacteriaceae bacterium]